MGSSKANPPMAQSEPGASPAAGGASERLESWKDIANYLKRGVTTVQRWEKQEGLPVHRHLHDKLGTVYAYKPEIDAWWENGRSRLEQQEQVRASSRRPLWWAVAAAVVVVAAAGVGLWLWLGQQPALPFEERDWVLIASFENRTGEAVFDGTLEYTLERELSNSRFVNVVPRQRINDTLQLMKKPLDTTVDAALGREVALRDGGIRALLTGRVEKLDSTYVLSAALVNPTKGTTVASFSEQAVGQREVVPALRRIASRVRETLGEELSSIEKTDEKLARVTTPSLRALQLYTQADAVIMPDRLLGNELAQELLKQAVSEDPEFASAYIWLAWVTQNEAEKRLYGKRALELSERTTERERYFIRGAYHHMLRQPEQALVYYQALLRLYPDHYWGTHHMEFLLNSMSRYEEGVRYRVRMAEIRPNAFVANALAAEALATFADNPVQARPYIRRGLALASREWKKTRSYEVWWLRFYSAHEHWLRGDLAEAQREVARWAQLLRAQSGRERDGLAHHVGQFYLTLGKLKAAEETFQFTSNSLLREHMLAWVAFLQEDGEEVKERFATQRPRSIVWQAIAAMLLIRAGGLSEAEELVRALETNRPSPRLVQEFYKIPAGELALAQGRPAEAISLLQDGIAMARPIGDMYYFLGAESLARAWEQQGNLEKAIEVLEDASQQKNRSYPGGAAAWIRVRVRLAQLYRKVGREREAQEIEAELLKLLAYADPDHPILLQLQRTQKSTTVQLRN